MGIVPVTDGSKREFSGIGILKPAAGREKAIHGMVSRIGDAAKPSRGRVSKLGPSGPTSVSTVKHAVGPMIDNGIHVARDKREMVRSVAVIDRSAGAAVAVHALRQVRSAPGVLRNVSRGGDCSHNRGV